MRKGVFAQLRKCSITITVILAQARIYHQYLTIVEGIEWIPVGVYTERSEWAGMTDILKYALAQLL
jgi:hypothetical protein